MRDTEFLSELLRIESPWVVTEANLDREHGRVDVRLEWRGPGRCPTCGCECPKHDHRERTWRDLDLCADHLYLHAVVPRVDCPEHGVLTVSVPWASGRSEFTSRFERLAIALLAEMSITAIAHVPDAAAKIVFDKFHVTSYLTKAVDLTRRLLMRDPELDKQALKGTKYVWLCNPNTMDRTERREFAELRERYTELARAWAIKEQFSEFWEYRRESRARAFFAYWYGWATRSKIPAIIDAAGTIKRHFANIITYLKIPITNAVAEGLNSKIQMIKYRARGYRNEDRLERAILFHCGGLDLLPAHSNS